MEDESYVLALIAETEAKSAAKHFSSSKQNLQDVSEEELNKLLADVPETHASRIREMRRTLKKK